MYKGSVSYTTWIAGSLSILAGINYYVGMGFLVCIYFIVLSTVCLILTMLRERIHVHHLLYACGGILCASVVLQLSFIRIWSAEVSSVAQLVEGEHRVILEVASDTREQFGIWKGRAKLGGYGSDIEFAFRAPSQMFQGELWEVIVELQSKSSVELHQLNQFTYNELSRGLELKVIRVIQRCSSPFQEIKNARFALLQTLDPHASPVQALSAALLCGYGGALHVQGISEMARNFGISHLFAVSGMHLTYVSRVIEKLLSLFSRSRFLQTLLQSIALGIAVLFTGSSASAMRAACMSISLRYSRLFGKQMAPLHTLGFCMILFLLWDPRLIDNLSFLLSVSSLFGLIVLSPIMHEAFNHEHVVRLVTKTRTQRRLHLKGEKLAHFFSEILASCSAQIATCWISLPRFYFFSPFAPALSAIFSSVFGGLMMIALIAVFCCIPPFKDTGLATAILDEGNALLCIFIAVSKLEGIGFELTESQLPVIFSLYGGFFGICLLLMRKSQLIRLAVWVSFGLLLAAFFLPQLLLNI